MTRQGLTSWLRFSHTMGIGAISSTVLFSLILERWFRQRVFATRLWLCEWVKCMSACVKSEWEWVRAICSELCFELEVSMSSHNKEMDTQERYRLPQSFSSTGSECWCTLWYCGVFLQHNCILMMCSFRSAKDAVIAIANIWFVLVFRVYDMNWLLVTFELE